MERQPEHKLSNNQSNTDTVIEENTLGCVKWFNSKLGYGFINILSSGEDIFVHHSSLLSESETFRYLVQGEYVQFNVAKTREGTYAKHAVSVTGIQKGRLLCDVHQTNYTRSSTLHNNTREGSSTRHYSVEDYGGREDTGNNYQQLRNSKYPNSKRRYTSPNTDFTGHTENTYRTPRSAVGK